MYALNVCPTGIEATAFKGPLIVDVSEAAEEQLQQHLGGEASTIAMGQRSIDQLEEHKVRDFCATSCGCRLVNNGPCSSQEQYTTTRANAAELTWSELNMTIMGQVMALTYCHAQPLNCSKHRHAPKERERSTTVFHHHGHWICKETFLYLHGVGSFV